MLSAAKRSAYKVQIDVIYAILLRELATRFGKSRGGFLWVLVEPVAHLLLPVFIMTYIRGSIMPGVDYPVFLVYGFLPFLIFKTNCLQIVNGINSARGVLSYRQVHLMDVFVANSIAYVVIQAVVFAIVLSGMVLIGFDVIPARFIEFFGVFILTVTLAFGLGLVLAAVASIIPDARPIIAVMFMPLYLISGVLFPVNRFPDEVVKWLAVNPVLHLVELSRAVAIDGYEPMKYLSLEYPVVLALASLFVGLMLYRLRVLTMVTT